ncbi:MAG: alcohol dehydrogenase, partial [Dorea sp.]
SVLLPITLEAYGTAAHKKLARLARLTGISDSDLDAVAAGEFIRHIRNMNLSMNIPETLDGIRNEDIPKLARYADKEANPLYPVPVLWGPSKLEQMYHLVQEVNENDRNRNSEHPGKAA